jgi:hypothetical protein
VRAPWRQLRKAGGDGGQDALESVGGSFAEAALLLLAQLAATE